MIPGKDVGSTGLKQLPNIGIREHRVRTGDCGDSRYTANRELTQVINKLRRDFAEQKYSRGIRWRTIASKQRRVNCPQSLSDFPPELRINRPEEIKPDFHFGTCRDE